MKTLISGGKVIDPSQGLAGDFDLLIDGKIIAKIDKPGKSKPDGIGKTIDARGCIVAPGLVDMHVHLREPGYEGKETIETGAEAAIAGGFTSLACMANTNPINDNQTVTGYILAKARAAKCKVFPIGACTVGLEGLKIADLGEMRGAGVVGYSDDGKTVMNAELQRRIFELAQQLDMPVLVHAEDQHLVAAGQMHEGAVSTELGLDGRPAVAEEIMVSRDIMLARTTGCRVHIQHVSSAGSIELIRWAITKKLPVTCEVTPHHLTLVDENIGDYDTNCKMAPPLRSAEDRKALIKALADGTIDAIATDHAPHGILLKMIEFDNAAFGIIGLETALGLTLRLVEEKKLTLTRAIEALTVAPARILGLDVGTLQVGRAADVCIFQPERTFVYTPERIRSKSKNSPFINWELPGAVRFTLVDGKVVYTG
ncbi:MAG TPA: dihydroorotase [bacterium]|nr:dihydroorotase [bacterium]